MSFFLLFENNAAPQRLDSFSDAAGSHGLREDRRLHTGSHGVILYRDLNGSATLFHKADNGDFIAVVGSLIYSGEVAPACLPALLADFRPADFAWQGLLGSHILLIHKAGRLHVCGDGLGANKVFSNERGNLWSNSFLAMLELGEARLLDAQACYEYVLNGAVFGRRSLVQGIASLPANSILTLDAQGVELQQRPSPIANRPPAAPPTLDAVAAQHVAQLQQVFEPIARNHGERIRLSFSGGFDSRLMLAGLLAHGARPTLFVYGDEDDEDVRIARTISQAEGLALECIDKRVRTPPEPVAFIGETEKNLFAFDGWKVETPLFDFGEDRRDRIARHRDGHVPLNGSLGEIYRDFFYMPNRRSSTGAVVSTFYSRYDPRAFTARFEERRYRAAMQAAMREAIGADDDRLQRSQVEELYPKFRGRFWTGRDAQLNQRFGPMYFPYLEPAAIANTAKIPLTLKQLGHLQGRMIARINPRLAAYPSDYGFALNGPRPAAYRLKTWLGTQRPAALRKLSFRMTHRTAQPRVGALAPQYLGQVIELDFPVMRKLFNIDAVHCATQYGLIATLEYLAQRYNLDSVAD